MRKEKNMKTFLLPENAKYYKACLHTHTTLSDGHKTPEQIKEDYKKHGYGAVAYTDHDKFIDHQNLTDDEFVALNAFELEYYITPWNGQTCHICYVAKDPKNQALGWTDPSYDFHLKTLSEGALNPEEGGQLYKVSCPGRKYDPAYINADIKAAKELGFYVTYNHPMWSLESYANYSEYKGMDAMEISNYDCTAAGYQEDNGMVYRDLLNLGNNIACIATDDCHNKFPDDDPRSDSYGGYIQLALEKLSYENVIKALENRNFYSCAKVNPGCGDAPQIKNLWIEDDVVHIETTPCASILLIKDKRKFAREIAGEGKTITEASFTVGDCSWYRLEVFGKNGCKAYTNAFFK